MINKIITSGFKQFVISIFVIFIVFPNTIIAQQSYQDIVNRVDEIDSEINRLTLLKEYIGMEFKRISDFSIQARPILTRHNEYEEVISLKKEERRRMIFGRISKEEIEAEIKILEVQQDDHHNNYKKSGGIISNIGTINEKKVKVQSKTIEELQREYTRITKYYLKQKTKYDKIAKALGELNVDKNNLEVKIKSMNDYHNPEPDLTGCWVLQFGNYISEITVSKHISGKFVGKLTVNNLEDYDDGQVVFVVSRINNNVFSGTEYIWKEKPDGMLGKKEIHAMITLNTDNNYLTWTSDQTVTMRRCR